MRRQHKALTEAAGRVCAIDKKTADAAGRNDDAAGIDHERAVFVHGEHTLDGVILDDQPARLDTFEQRESTDSGAPAISARA
jgi:hypothetical protein